MISEVNRVGYFKNKSIENLGWFKIGIYIRLSREDGDDLESESVSNQRSLITGFLLANGINTFEEYVDDGYSGCNFNRPGFIRLLNDIENKKINLVITKDLSRLGRDYIETGNYIEKIFPSKNIRYIAINDDIDTFMETSGSDMMPFKLSMNDMYAKDISKKVRSALYTLKNEGKYCASTTPYGYKRSNEDKHKLVIVPEEAEVVKKIFSLYVTGYSTSEIAQLLTMEGVKTPILRTEYVNRIGNCNHPEIWKRVSVSNIIKNRIYLGEVIQHRTERVNYKIKKMKRVPESDWLISKNMHEPIIDYETFEVAQKIRNKSNNYSSNRKIRDYLLSGKLYCADCGKTMAICFNKQKDYPVVNCTTYQKFSKYNLCFSHRLNYKKVENTILNYIKDICSKYIDPTEYEKILEKIESPTKDLENKINVCQNKIKRLESKLESLYDDKFGGIISEEMFVRISKSTNNEIEVLNDKCKNYKKELKCLQENKENVFDSKQIINDFFAMKNPTKEMINRIIDKIVVTKDKELKVYFKINDLERIKEA